MGPDYAKWGLKVGLELHQQLDTGKLFCRCPCRMVTDAKPDYVFERRLRPTASELGELDAAALREFLKEKLFSYEGFFELNCLIEADCEPIMPVNERALETVLEVACMVNARVLDELFPMRKVIIDGSAVSGFQRTILVAVNGFVEVNGARIGVPTLILEEDAARVVWQGRDIDFSSYRDVARTIEEEPTRRDLTVNSMA
ncbi:MAG: Glu-tRNA(Gln) amidotransferase GatDE subunit E, partial [Candidatus Diapherotrites archaeon]|nr:Glu-tRNA(Gln) amidotransferase GatDE subunit E [Candidatus Diapherotrites archaeon]